MSESDDIPTEPSGLEIAPGVVVPPHVVRFSYASSSGPGGQSVNRRSSKALMRVDPREIPMPAPARARLKRLGARWMVDPGELLIICDEHRTQRRNREECLARLRELMVRAMTPPKPRKKTKPSKGAIERRLQSKRERSERKERRKKPGPE
ncbi:MAG: alternative ribosome rescue aminoacyl-tRNA hydrolase ArfB [Phycisphaerales bacterium JB037]